MSSPDRPTYPVREPAPGPIVILDLPRLWAAVDKEARRRGMVHRSTDDIVLKLVSDVTGVDRTTLGRIRERADEGSLTEGQRGGININAYLSLVSFAHNGLAAAYGRELRGGIQPYHLSPYPYPGPEPTPEESHAAILAE